MVIVKGTRGPVQVEIIGVAQALAFLRRKGKDIEDGSDLGVFRAANFLQGEIQESIIGNRPETRSVDTGRFANSIKLDKIKNAEYQVFTKVPYAKFLEFGTSRMQPRQHFRNSASRNRKKIRNIIKEKLL